MSDKNIHSSINELNSKLDFIIEEVTAQKNNRIERADLFEDLSIVGKDMFATTVNSLDKAGVELDSEALGALLIKLIRNIGTFNKMMDTLESANDFMKDASPIINQIGLDAIAKLSEFEQKGYIDFIKELLKISDTVVANFTVEDIKNLSKSIVPMIELIKNAAQPEVFSALNKTVSVFRDMQDDEIPKFSMWQVFKMMRKPEMKKALGFMMTFTEKLASNK